VGGAFGSFFPAFFFFVLRGCSERGRPFVSLRSPSSGIDRQTAPSPFVCFVFFSPFFLPPWFGGDSGKLESLLSLFSFFVPFPSGGACFRGTPPVFPFFFSYKVPTLRECFGLVLFSLTFFFRRAASRASLVRSLFLRCSLSLAEPRFTLPLPKTPLWLPFYTYIPPFPVLLPSRLCTRAESSAPAAGLSGRFLLPSWLRL